MERRFKHGEEQSRSCAERGGGGEEMPSAANFLRTRCRNLHPRAVSSRGLKTTDDATACPITTTVLRATHAGGGGVGAGERGSWWHRPKRLEM